MFFRIINFVVLMVCAVSTSVWSVPDAQDLVITYSVPAKKRQALFQDIVKGSVSGKTKPDNYHVTLGWVNKVDSTDYVTLRNYLNAIATTSLTQRTTFTATAAKRYLVNRKPNSCGIVLTPKGQEEAKFKRINKLLHDALKHYNKRTGKAYVFHKDLLPQAYVPHITLANVSHIQSQHLDRNTLIRQMNTKIKGKNLELLHDRGVGASNNSAKNRHIQQVAKSRKKANQQKCVAAQHKRVAHRRPVRHAAVSHKQAVVRHRHALVRHRKALKHRRHR